MIRNNEIEIIENHFKAYNDLIYEVNMKSMKLIGLKENWYNLSGIKYDDVKIKGGIPFDIADQLHDIVEKEKELKATIDYKEELRRVHEKEIDVLGKSYERTVLKMFYLDKCSIKQIAYCLKLSEGHVKKIKRFGVHEFIKRVIDKIPNDTK